MPAVQLSVSDQRQDRRRMEAEPKPDRPRYRAGRRPHRRACRSATPRCLEAPALLPAAQGLGGAFGIVPRTGHRRDRPADVHDLSGSRRRSGSGRSRRIHRRERDTDAVRHQTRCGQGRPGRSAGDTLPTRHVRKAADLTLLEGIAERIGRIAFADLPPEAVHWAKTAILDTVGVTLAGAAEPCTQIVARVLAAGTGAGSGECLIFGSDRRAAPLDAALINGTAAHALDFDDVSNSMGGHPSAPIVPALFAAGEILDSTGREFIAAYVAGFETETRIGRGVNLHHYEKGWHPTATLGVFGAAAACCHLMGLDRAKTAQALAIAASLASGIKANFGTMTKPLHVGHTARNGLFAAMLAREGFTANDAALEHRQGFLS